MAAWLKCRTNGRSGRGREKERKRKRKEEQGSKRKTESQSQSLSETKTNTKKSREKRKQKGLLTKGSFLLASGWGRLLAGVKVVMKRNFISSRADSKGDEAAQHPPLD